MEFIKDRIKEFEIYKLLIKTNDYGDVIKKYAKAGYGQGDLQPITNSNLTTIYYEEQGIERDLLHKLFTKEKLNIGDRIKICNIYYEVEKIISWDSFFIYTVREKQNE